MFGRRYFGPRYFGPRYWMNTPKGLTITSTRVLQKPVDYALAGDQDVFRGGRMRGGGLRRIFGE